MLYDDIPQPKAGAPKNVNTGTDFLPAAPPPQLQRNTLSQQQPKQVGNSSTLARKVAPAASAVKDVSHRVILAPKPFVASRWSAEYNPFKPNTYASVKAELRLSKASEYEGGASVDDIVVAPFEHPTRTQLDTWGSQETNRGRSGTHAGRPSPVSAVAENSLQMNPAVLAMMQRMGYVKGKGLGAMSQGRVDPIGASGNDGRGGLGKGLTINVTSTFDCASTPSVEKNNPGKESSNRSSRILLIQNFLRSDASQLEALCVEFGHLTKFVLREDAMNNGTPTGSSACAVFQDSTASIRAALGLQGLQFQGTELRVSLHPEYLLDWRDEL
jgi:G-patch domain